MEYAINIGLFNISIHDLDIKSSNVLMKFLKMRTLYTKKSVILITSITTLN